jgi:hypothetical protein
MEEMKIHTKYLSEDLEDLKNLGMYLGRVILKQVLEK